MPAQRRRMAAAHAVVVGRPVVLLTLLLTGPVTALVAGLAGCASDVPVMVRTAPVPPVSVAAAQRDPARYTGREVRWGGSILGVTNRRDRTEISVLARPLADGGRPQIGTGGDTGPVAAGEGRFLAELPGFIDPTTLPTGRLITVAGTLTGVRVQPVGDYPYPYPVVAATSRFLWPEPVPVSPDPWCCDPWGGPWGGPGWGGWGWGGWGGWPGPWHGPWYGPPPRRVYRR